MRILVTGASGFVGPFLLKSLRDATVGAVILATGRNPRVDIATGPIEQLDVTDYEAVCRLIARFKCTHIVHLAGLTAITAAATNPGLAWQVNVQGSLNVANAILQENPTCKLIHVSSGQVYGWSARKGPVDESALLDPVDSYSVTKASADLAIGALARQGLSSIRMRPFNHTGPGQTESFVVPSFAMQVARIEAGLQPPIVNVGNLDVERDFLDVRDVVRAYVLAALAADQLPSGQIINVASGSGQSVRNILNRLLALSSVPIRVEQAPGRIRSNDLLSVIGNASEARRLLGWSPEFGIDDTLASVLTACRLQIAQN